MRNLGTLIVCFALSVAPSLAFAGGGGGPKGPKFDWKTSHMIKVADDFVQKVGAGQYEQAYQSGGEVLRKLRTLEEFTTDLKNAGLDQVGSVTWENGNKALPANGGFKLMGTFTPKGYIGWYWDHRYLNQTQHTKFCNGHWDLCDGKIILPQISKTKKTEMLISCIPHF